MTFRLPPGKYRRKHRPLTTDPFGSVSRYLEDLTAYLSYTCSLGRTFLYNFCDFATNMTLNLQISHYIATFATSQFQSLD